MFGFLTQIETPFFHGLLIFGGAIAGIVFSYSWYRIVKSFKQLSATKWKIVLELEKKLPVKLHETEWKMLEGKDGKKYRQLTGVEQGVPFVFIMIYVSIIVSVIFSSIL